MDLAVGVKLMMLVDIISTTGKTIMPPLEGPQDPFSDHAVAPGRGVMGVDHRDDPGQGIGVELFE